MNQTKESDVKKLLIGSMFVVAMVTSTLAQDRTAPAPPRSPQPQAKPQPPAPSPLPGVDQPNVRFDITISEEGGGPMPVRKSVMLLVQGGGGASLRSVAQTAPS